MTTRAMWYGDAYLARGSLPAGSKPPRYSKCLKPFRCECWPYSKGQPQVRCAHEIQKGETYFNTGCPNGAVVSGIFRQWPRDSSTPPGRICLNCANEVLQHVDGWVVQSRRLR